MNNRGLLSTPTKNAIYGFFLVTLAMFAIGLLRKKVLIDENTARRALGFFIGILMVVVGNYLPKSRFLKTLRWTSPSAAAAERLTGWAFVLTGAVDVCAFVMTPLSLARSLSACLGAILVLAILVTGLSLWIGSRCAARSGDLEVETEPKTRQQSKGLSLLVALVWVLISAFMKYFWDDASWSKSPVLAVIYVGLFYATVIPLLKSSDRRKGEGGRCI